MTLHIFKDSFGGEAEFVPSFEPTSQRADVYQTSLSQLQRHTGAGGFVWSSAVEDDFVFAGDFVRAGA